MERECDCDGCDGSSSDPYGRFYGPGCQCICHHLKEGKTESFFIGQKEIRYKALIPVVRAYARKKGYAVGVHGSLQRDLDLIAAPWIDRAISPRELMSGIMKLVGGFHSGHHETIKPCGRLAYSIMLPGKMMKGKWIHGYIDLSIMPKLTGELSNW